LIVNIDRVKVQMALGTSWRNAIASASPVAWYRLNEEVGATVALDYSGNGRNGTYVGGPTLQVASALVEGGYAATFNGTSQRVTCGDLTAFEFAGAFSIEAVFNFTSTALMTVVSKLSSAPSGYALYVQTGKIRAIAYSGGGVSIFNPVSTLTYNDGLSHHVLLTWDGTTGANKVNLFVDGVLASQVTATGTPAGTGGTVELQIASDQTGADWFAGTIDEVAVYGRELTTVEKDAHYAAYAVPWTDVTADLAPNDLTFTYGIRGNGPTDHLADGGTEEYWLRNDSSNSGAKDGYYSPDHINCRTGFTYGILTRTLVTYAGVDYQRWIGTVDEIEPESGRLGSRRTRIGASGLMRGLIDAQLKNLTLQTNTTERAALQQVFLAMPASAQPLCMDFDTGVDTLPYIFDDIGAGARAIALVGDLVLSSMGYGFVDRLGCLRYENRQARQTSSSTYTFDNTMKSFVVPTSLSNVFNHVRLEFPLKHIDAAATTVLFSIPDASTTNPSTISIAAGATIEIWGTYFNPNNVKQNIGGTAQAALVITTDYKANTLADDSGTAKAANITIVTTNFATVTLFQITNNDAGAVFLTRLKVKGKGLYNDGDAPAVEATSMQPYGERSVTIRLPYQSDPNVAQDLADYILAQFENITGQASSMMFLPHESDAQMLSALGAEVGDRITVQEQQTGFIGDLFIHEISWTIKEQRYVEVTYGLAATIFADTFWILEAATSTLGTNTIPGYG